MDHLASAVEFEPHVSITLLSKVLHRKRPGLIPLLDRHVIDWFRPVTRERTPARAWGPLLRSMRDDADANRVLVMAILLHGFKTATRPDRIGVDVSNTLSLVRATDIAIWMGSR